jgi:hypothetical protein
MDYHQRWRWHPELGVGLSEERRHPEIEEVGAATGPAMASCAAGRRGGGGATSTTGGRQAPSGMEGQLDRGMKTHEEDEAVGSCTLGRQSHESHDKGTHICSPGR